MVQLLWARVPRQDRMEQYVFFFQAEDGIRDVAVTGVQTCALPISSRGGGDVPRTACQGYSVGAVFPTEARQGAARSRTGQDGAGAKPREAGGSVRESVCASRASGDGVSGFTSAQRLWERRAEAGSRHERHQTGCRRPSLFL